MFGVLFFEGKGGPKHKEFMGVRGLLEGEGGGGLGGGGGFLANFLMFMPFWGPENTRFKSCLEKANDFCIRMRLFCLQLEASCLQWSFLHTVDNFSFFTYNWIFFAYNFWLFYLQLELLCLQWESAPKRRLKGL